MTEAQKPLAGRKIRLVAPARWVTPADADAFAEYAESWGAQLEVDPQCFVQDGQLAGDDAAREAALSAALAERDAVVWGARGGYGALRLLEILAARGAAPKARVFVGYSDMTAIHQHLWGMGMTVVHGAMPFDLQRPEKVKNVEAAARMIGTVLRTGHATPRRYPLKPGRKGSAAAPLVPANLSVLTRLIGTPHEPKWESAIICLEDVEEYLYALDRMFWHLSASKLAPRIKGIVLGEFSATLDNEIPWGRTVAEIALLHFPGIPVASGLPFGHGTVNLPLIVGEPAVLEVGADASLSLSADLA